MTWYKKWFSEDYIDVYPHRDENEAEQFIKTLERYLPLEPGNRILDLCCGAGRYAVALALRGYEVTGLDLSETMIQNARSIAKKEEVRVDFLIRDMRDVPFVDHFDLIINMFTSFGYFRSDEDNAQVIEAAARALKSGGWMALDFMNRSFIVTNLRTFDEHETGYGVIRQQRQYDRDTDRMEKLIWVEKGGESKQYRESVKLYSPDELNQLFKQHGLIPVYSFGDYDGSPYLPDSSRIILIGQKEE